MNDHKQGSMMFLHHPMVVVGNNLQITGRTELRDDRDNDTVAMQQLRGFEQQQGKASY